MFGICLWCLVSTWGRRTNWEFFAIPFATFGVFEAVWTWPCAIYAQATGLCGALPAALTAAAFLCFVGGYVTNSRRDVGRRAHAVAFRDLRLTRDGPEFAYAVCIVAFSIALFAAGVYLYRGIPPIVPTLRDLATGTDHSEAIGSLSAQREDILKAHYFGGEYRAQGALSTLTLVGWLYLAYVAQLMYRMLGKQRWLALFAITFGMGLVFIAGVGQRSQVVMVFIYLLAGRSLCARMSMAKIAIALMLVAVAILVVTPFSGQMIGTLDDNHSPFSFVVQKAVERIAIGNGITNIEIMRFIADGELQYGWGQIHLEKLINSIPGTTKLTPFALRVSDLRGSTTRTAFSSSTYLGVLYADFGAVGVLCGYAAIGIATGWLERTLFRMRKTVLQLPMIAFVVLYWSDLSVSAPIGMAATFFVLLVFSTTFRVGIALFVRTKTAL
jgi:hypothetical protein